MYFPSINLFKNILLLHIALKQEAAKIWKCDYSIADSDIANGQLDSMSDIRICVTLLFSAHKAS